MKKYSKDYTNESLIKNEISANNEMIKAAIITAGVLFIIWFFYLFNTFKIDKQSALLASILFPINIVALLSTYLFRKTKLFKKPSFKYLLLYTFVSVYFVINVVIPKHGIVAWAIPIILANHYYDPKAGRRVYIVTMIAMLLALYAGMFFGEYDTNLLDTGVVVLNNETGLYEIYQPVTAKERFDMLHQMILDGNNRYLKVFLYYYMSRGILLTILFSVSQGLNVRTYNLLESEIASTTDKKQIETELDIARNIQMTALPKELSNFVGASIITELIAAKEVGGDLYDYEKLDDTHIAITIGDVSGKGIPAAMFMMKCITCFKAYSKLGKHPSEILKEVNRTLYDGNDSQMFLTCFYGILDTKTGILEFANAGHNKPLISSKGKYHYLECDSGFILGVLEEAIVKDEVIKLEDGDNIFMYTDGITEAKNKNDELYGEDRLLEFSNSKVFSSIVDYHYELKENIKNFVSGADQSDDMTYLILNYSPSANKIYERAFLEDEFDTKYAIDFVSKTLEELGLSDYLPIMSVVVDEIFSNMVKYSYDGDKGLSYIKIIYNDTSREIAIVFVDMGKEFNPLEAKEEKIEEYSDELKEGGLGLLIVKNTMDSMAYSRINGKNILVVKKVLW